MAKVTKQQAEHIVGKISGVKPGDTKVQAAEKAIALMKQVGMPAHGIRKAERILAQLKAQEK